MSCYRTVKIEPVTSGQEFTLSASLFRYPKFVVESGKETPYFDASWNSYSFYNIEIDKTVIRKLAIRNMTISNSTEKDENGRGYYERKWLEYLAKYMLLCDDKNSVCDVINIFFDKPIRGFSMTSRVYELPDNYKTLMKSAEDILEDVLGKQTSKTGLQAIGMWTEREGNINIIIENYFLLMMVGVLKVYSYTGSKQAIDSIRGIGSIAGGIEEYYGNGTRISYLTRGVGDKLDEKVIPVCTYISRAIKGDSISELSSIWKYFNGGKASSFATMLVLNVAATVGLSFIPVEMATVAVAASLIWTVGGSFAGLYIDTKLQEDFDEKSHMQSLESLIDLLKALNTYGVFANTGEEYTGFMYKVFQGSDTKTRIDTFMYNIEYLYIQREDGEKSLKSIFDINIEKYRQKTGEVKADIQINALVEALTLKIMTNEKVFGKKEYNEKDGAAKTGMDILKKLNKLTITEKINEEIKNTIYPVMFKLSEEWVPLDNTTCIVKNGNKGTLMSLEQFFTEKIKKKYDKELV